MNSKIQKVAFICAVGIFNIAHAQSLGKERFTVIAPFPPGGPVDTLARIVADGLAKKYNTSSVVENVPGGAGNIGMERVKRAKNDGHTLLLIPAGNLTINPTLMKNFPFDIDKDFTPITMIAKAPNVLVASATSNLKSVKDVIATAKANPNALIFASPGIGSGLHLAGELFKAQTEIEMTHIPYKGSPQALNDVVAGIVPLMFTNLPAAQAHIKGGKLVAIGLTDEQRSSAAQEIPTLAEQGVKGVVVVSWYGLLAPANLPPQLANELFAATQDIFSASDIREKLKAQGMNEVLSKPNEFGTYIRNETAVWAKIIKTKNISAE